MSGTRRVARVLALCTLLLAVTALLAAAFLSPATMSWLRADYPVLGQPMNWLERVAPGIGMVHLLLFAGIALPLTLLWRGATWWMLGLVLLALAVGTELFQFAVPGRSPGVLDLRDDLMGAVVGMALAFGLRRLWLSLCSRNRDSLSNDTEPGNRQE